MSLMMIMLIVQAFFAVIIGLYFWGLLRNQHTNKSAIDKESKKEMEKWRRMRSIRLSEPLAEKARPTSIEEIVGQKEGLMALRAALCGPNPQHVLIYGPPGVGKTAAARVILEEAKKMAHSPFNDRSVFIEVDATTARFDERGIADPLIGSVHDPIYQGAGAMGVAGIPQPKPGAVTKAHGGILFIDEIGELHPVQMNKLLKVLEDRKVFLESSYYSSEDKNIPNYIHDIFQNGLPADFRLVGATTRSPHEIPPAIRSRCMEVFFRPLLAEEIETIATKAIAKMGFKHEQEAVDIVKKYASNGREAINIVQFAIGLAILEGRDVLLAKDMEWVVQSRQMSPRPERKIHARPEVGLVNGLAVSGMNVGSVLEIEVIATPVTKHQKSSWNVTGIIDEEQIGDQSRTLRRKSMVKSSIENVLTLLQRIGIPVSDYHIHINFPGGAPMDGPSAGIAIATGIVSAIYQIPIKNTVAMTGEVSIHGRVKPVGGIVAKVEAAVLAGATQILIPRDNDQKLFQELQGANVFPVDTIHQVLEIGLGLQWDQLMKYEKRNAESVPSTIVTALQAERTVHP